MITANQVLISMSLFFSITVLASNPKWEDTTITGNVERCFSLKDVKIHCEDFSQSNREKVEELQIIGISRSGAKYNYSYQKGIEGKLCREHLGIIGNLGKKEKFVCITGSGEFFDNENKETISKFRSLETKRGKLVWW